MPGFKRTWRRHNGTIGSGSQHTADKIEPLSPMQESNSTKPTADIVIAPGVDGIRGLKKGDMLKLDDGLGQTRKILSIQRFDDLASLFASDKVATLASKDPVFWDIISSPYAKEKLKQMVEETAETETVDGIYLIVAVRLSQ